LIGARLQPRRRIIREVPDYKMFSSEERTMHRIAVLLVVMFGLALMASVVHADSLVLTLDTLEGSADFGPAPYPSTTPPWATATFTQVNADTVQLVMSPDSGLGLTSFIVNWGFNDGGLGVLTITPDAATATKVAGMGSPYNRFFVPNFVTFDYGISFDNSTFMNPAALPFYISPEDPTFTITSSAGALTVEDFDVYNNSTNPLLTEAELEDAGAVWGATTSGSIISTVVDTVPTPSSASAGLVLLTGLAMWTFIRSRSTARTLA
jgi:hypothetical protein